MRVMGALKAYAPRNNRYVEAKNKLVNNVENFYIGREKIIKGFENKIFPLLYDEERVWVSIKSLKRSRRRRKRTKKKKKGSKKKKKRTRRNISRIFWW